MKVDSNWEDGKYHLYQGDFTNWLGANGRADIASKTRDIISGVADKDIGLETFLQSLGSDAPPAPELKLDKAELNFGKADVEKIPKGKYAERFGITNSSRGHLYGMVSSSKPWLQVDVTEFSGNSVTVIAKAIKSGRQANITVSSNGGMVTIPVRMNPTYTWFKRVFITSLISMAAAAIFRVSAVLPLWVLSQDTWGWFSNSVPYLSDLLKKWYAIENITGGRFYIILLTLSLPAVVGLLAAWLAKKVRILQRYLHPINRLAIRLRQCFTSLTNRFPLRFIPKHLFKSHVVVITSLFIWSAMGMFIISPLLLIITWGIDFAIQPSFSFISSISIYGWCIAGLLVGSVIGLLKWLRKIRKPLMYPLVIGGLPFVLALFWAVGIILK